MDIQLKSTHIHTHTFNGPFPGLPGCASTRKVKPIWILLKQETVSGSGISWAICKSASRSRQMTTPAPHYSFLQAGCPSCHPTNRVKALKAINKHTHTHRFNGPLSGTTRVSRYQKGKTNLAFTGARDSEWQWHQLGMCKSAPRSKQITTPAPHQSVFYRPDALPATQPTASKH